MKRREFITLLGGGAAGWPRVARTQQLEQMRRIGALYVLSADDPETQARHSLFQQSLTELGWTIDQNLHLDIRQAGGNPADIRRYAAELVALAPDAILAVGSATVAPLQQSTQTIPIVFVNVADPLVAFEVYDIAGNSLIGAGQPLAARRHRRSMRRPGPA